MNLRLSTCRLQRYEKSRAKQRNSFLFLPRRSKFAIFDGKVTKKRVKCKRKACFSFHFRVQSKFGEAKGKEKVLIIKLFKEKEYSLLKEHSSVEVTGLEPATAWSQTRNATNCATPRFCGCKGTHFL